MIDEGKGNISMLSEGRPGIDDLYYLKDGMGHPTKRGQISQSINGEPRHPAPAARERNLRTDWFTGEADT